MIFMSRKIVILYEKMGMGHLRMAGILEDMLKGDDIIIEKYAASEIVGSSDIDLIVNTWNYCIKKNWIRFVDILLNFLTRLFVLPVLDVAEGITLQKKLEEIKPDIIICTADGYNKSIGTYAAQKGIPFYIFITEISIFIDLVNPYARHICYFDETVEAIRNYNFDLTYYSYHVDHTMNLFHKITYVLNFYNDFITHSFKNSIYRNPENKLIKNNHAKCHVIGPLAEKRHFDYKDMEALKLKYELPKNRENIMVVSGSIGGRFLLSITKRLIRECNRPINLLVMCGRDKKIYDKLRLLKTQNSNINIIPFGYINHFDEILAISDCLIARPSAGIFIESLLNTTPMITFDKVTSNDKGTLTMIKKYGIGEVCEDEDALAAAMEKILKSKDVYQSNIHTLRQMYCFTYEEKEKLIREVILENNSVAYGEEKSIFMDPVFSNN